MNAVAQENYADAQQMNAGAQDNYADAQ